MGNFIKRVWGKKKNKDTSGETKAEIPAEIFGSFSYKIKTKDGYLAEQLRQNIKSAYAPFTSNGKLKIKMSEKFIGLTHAQVVNFFHVPTAANFIKGMDYCVYRKLPYPTNLPTTKNSDPSDLTILGMTDYR